MLLEGAAAAESPLGRALGIAMTAGADQTFRDVVREAIGRRDVIDRWLGSAGGLDAAISSPFAADSASSRERTWTASKPSSSPAP